MMARQRGFGLPEVLCALTLFALVIILLMNYFCELRQGAERQWQIRQVWRYALEQLEPESPALPEGWTIQKQQIPCGHCLCVSVTVTSPQGRSGQLSKKICSSSLFSQE